jgi:hypothetical protein
MPAMARHELRIFTPVLRKVASVGDTVLFVLEGFCRARDELWDRYERETTKGISRVWKYTIDLEAIQRSATTASSSSI